jgi:hypothetical protein
LDKPGFSMGGGRPSTAGSSRENSSSSAAKGGRPGTGERGARGVREGTYVRPGSARKGGRAVTSSGYGQVRGGTPSKEAGGAHAAAAQQPADVWENPEFNGAESRALGQAIPSLGLGVSGAPLYSGQPAGAVTPKPQQLRTRPVRAGRSGADSGGRRNARPPPSTTTTPSRRPGTGQVPAYLVARKQAWAEEERAQAEYEADMRDCPPGKPSSLLCMCWWGRVGDGPFLCHR